MCFTVKPCVAIDLAQLTMNFDRRYALCIQKLCHRTHFTGGGSLNKSLHHQPPQLCYLENSGSCASAWVMWRHYSIAYKQSLRTINGLIAVGRVGTLLCGRASCVCVCVCVCVCIHTYIWSSSECSAQGQVLHYLRRNLGCSTGECRFSTVNPGVKSAVLPGIG